MGTRVSQCWKFKPFRQLEHTTLKQKTPKTALTPVIGPETGKRAKDERDDETMKERYGRVHCSLKSHYQITNKSPRNHCRIKNVNVKGHQSRCGVLRQFNYNNGSPPTPLQN